MIINVMQNANRKNAKKSLKSTNKAITDFKPQRRIISKIMILPVISPSEQSLMEEIEEMSAMLSATANGGIKK